MPTLVRPNEGAIIAWQAYRAMGLTDIQIIDRICRAFREDFSAAEWAMGQDEAEDNRMRKWFGVTSPTSAWIEQFLPIHGEEDLSPEEKEERELITKYRTELERL